MQSWKPSLHPSFWRWPPPFMLVFSIPLGIYTAVKQNTWFDYLVRGRTLPVSPSRNFWMGLMLLWIFALKLSLFPDRRRFDFPRKSDPADVHPGHRHGIEIHPSGSVPRCSKNCIRTTSRAHVPAASRKATSSGVKSCRMPSSRWSPSFGLAFGSLLAVPLS